MVNMANSTCLSGGLATNLSSTAICIDGFYCPNNSALFPPEFCPPTADCQVTRLQQAHNICDRPQGIYEPMICKAGFYCPPGGRDEIICPGGHFCPLGSVKPTQCLGISICPEGSSRQIHTVGFVCIIILDILLVASWSSFLWDNLLPRLARRIKSSLGGREKADIQLESGHLTDQNEIQRTASTQLIMRHHHADTGIEISFENISLRPKNSVRAVLSRQNGRVHASSLLGVMGPSGSGKSTLIGIIAGRIKPTTGQVYINNRPARPNHLRDLIAFVPQDDIAMPDLTVRENILHSARVRLGGFYEEDTLQGHVNALIELLGLERVQDQLTGDMAESRISGGERKRVNVALELAAAPSILVLDEPTSGLDASSALSLLQLLKRLTQQGMTVVCVVHQPRAEIFAALDDLLLLKSGEQIYFGKAADAYENLVGPGQDSEVSKNLNPNVADIIIDSISSYEKVSSPNADGELHSTTTGNQFIQLECQYEESGVKALVFPVKQRRASWHQQVYLNLLRGITQQRRQYASFALEIASGAITGLLIGLSNYEFKGHLFQGLFHEPFEKLSSSVNYRLIGEQGMLCCLAIACAAGPAGVRTFGTEKLVFFRESNAGHSRSAYVLGKVLSTFSRIFLSALHFTTFYAVLTTPIIPFGMQLGLNTLYFFCIYGLGCIVASVTSPQNGPLLTMLVSVMISALGGCAPRLASVKAWNLEWFWYLWPALWYSEALFNESTAPLSYLYNIGQAASETGYIVNRTNFDICIILLIGCTYHLISLLIFDLIARRRTR